MQKGAQVDSKNNVSLFLTTHRGLQYSVCVCLSLTVSDTTLQASVVDRTPKFRHQRSVNETLQCFDSWILLTMLGSKDMSKFVNKKLTIDHTHCQLHVYGTLIKHMVTS